MEHTAIQTMV